MSTLEVKELSHPAGEVIKIASGKTLDLNSQGDVKMPAGSVIQVVTREVTGPLATTSTTYVEATNQQISITTTQENSRILLRNTVPIQTNQSGNNRSVVSYRSSIDSYSAALYEGLNVAYSDWTQSLPAIEFIHSPSQVSGTEITYKAYFANTVGGSTTYWFDNWGQAQKYTITLMEIAG